MLMYRFGDIVLVASLLDPQGRNPKDRPSVVLRTEVYPDGTIGVDVMAITTFIPSPLPDDFILLPWSLPRHPRTGLNKRCAAVASWTETIAFDRIQRLIGFVPGRQRTAILAMIPSEEGEPDSD